MLNPEQRQTAFVLLTFCTLALLAGVGLLTWEFVTVAAPAYYGQHATISETVSILFHAQPAAFFLAGVVVTGVTAFLLGHMFWSMKRD